MAKPGPKPRAAAVKKARGTAQKCRDGGAKDNVVPLQVVQAIEELPPAPEWFMGLQEDWPSRKFMIAMDTYEKLCHQLFTIKVLAPVHADALATLASVQAEVAIALRNGTCSAAMLTQLRTLYAEFGLTPAAQKAVSPRAAAPVSNKFAGNGNRSRA